MISGTYRCIDYEIDNNENGSSYSVFERTPVTHTKCEISFGSSCNWGDFTEDYVRNVINNIFERLEKEDNTEEARLNCRYMLQLVRAEEEIEKWKHQAELGSDTIDKLYKELEDKNQENEKLKSENFTFEELIKTQDNEIKKLREWQEANKPTGICETCTAKSVEMAGEMRIKLQVKEQECERLIRDYFKQNKWLQESVKERKEYKQALDEIERLLSGALDTEKTDTDESFENFYKCLDIIKKRKRWNNAR